MDIGTFYVEDVIKISGRGVAAIGTVIKGSFSFGDSVIIRHNNGAVRESEVINTGIISSFDICGFRDRLALFLTGVAKEDIAVGDIIERMLPE